MIQMDLRDEAIFLFPVSKNICRGKELTILRLRSERTSGGFRFSTLKVTKVHILWIVVFHRPLYSLVLLSHFQILLYHYGSFLCFNINARLRLNRWVMIVNAYIWWFACKRGCGIFVVVAEIGNPPIRWYSLIC